MIDVDPRAGSGDFLPRFLKAGVQARHVTLSSGDVAWNGMGPDGDTRVGVEIKTWSDLLNSITTGRAQDQLARMIEDYPIRSLLIVGRVKVGKTGQMVLYRGSKRIEDGRETAKLHGFLMGAQEQAGFRITLAENKTSATLLLTRNHIWWQKPWDAHRSMSRLHCAQSYRHRRNGSVLSIMDRGGLVAKMAAQLPMIGDLKARAVEKRFNTVKQMLEAKVEDWMSVEGVGEKSAIRVWMAIRKERS